MSVTAPTVSRVLGRILNSCDVANDIAYCGIFIDLHVQSGSSGQSDMQKSPGTPIQQSMLGGDYDIRLARSCVTSECADACSISQPWHCHLLFGDILGVGHTCVNTGCPAPAPCKRYRSKEGPG